MQLKLRWSTSGAPSGTARLADLSTAPLGTPDTAKPLQQAQGSCIALRGTAATQNGTPEAMECDPAMKRASRRSRRRPLVVIAIKQVNETMRVSRACRGVLNVLG
ncbi:hypothetical protein ACWDZ8_13990 [Streptomyces sp. NPDC003233]